MTYNEWKLQEIQTKYAERWRNKRLKNKNMNIDDMRRKYRAITAKSGQNAVKTRNTEENPCGEVIFDEIRAHGDPIKPPVSDTNPNAVFKHKKAEARFNNYYSIPKDTEKIEEEKEWPDWTVDDEHLDW